MPEEESNVSGYELDGQEVTRDEFLAAIEGESALSPDVSVVSEPEVSDPEPYRTIDPFAVGPLPDIPTGSTIDDEGRVVTPYLSPIEPQPEPVTGGVASQPPGTPQSPEITYAAIPEAMEGQKIVPQEDLPWRPTNLFKQFNAALSNAFERLNAKNESDQFSVAYLLGKMKVDDAAQEALKAT